MIRNRIFNVDVFGVLRHRYLSPAFAIKFGERAIKNCFRDQLNAIRQEGRDNMGIHPCVFTELGIPYDMDNGAAYKTGDYTSQILAMDANHFALETGKQNFTLWNYTASNSHQWGDQWNGEDLSIFSTDDQPLPMTSASLSGGSSSASLDTDASSLASRDPKKEQLRLLNRVDDPEAGHFRAAQAYIRPTPVATHGDLQSHLFDLRANKFMMEVTAQTPASDDAPSEIFLPTFHFERGQFDVQTSGGRWDLDVDDTEGTLTQRLRWWNPAGNHSLTVKASSRRTGLSLGKAEDEGWIDLCMDKCQVM